MGKRSKRRHEDLGGELNLVPYMDIVVNLILFLMVSSTGLLQLGAIDVSTPQFTGDDTAPDVPPLLLTITISAAGFRISDAQSASTSIAGYDYVALTKALAVVKASAPHETHVTIAADTEVSFETVVSVADAARKDGATLLFPDMSLTPRL